MVNGTKPTLAQVYNETDVRPDKRRLRWAETGKTPRQQVVEELRGTATWNMRKAEDFQGAAVRADAAGNLERAKLHRIDAEFHVKCAVKQRREADRLEAEGQAA